MTRCNHSIRHAAPEAGNGHCFILPPYMLEAAAQHPDSAVRDAALATMAIDRTLRDSRLQQHAANAARRGTQESALATGSTAPEKRSIYDAKHKETLPGTLKRGEEAAATGDAAIDEAYDGLGATWTLYSEIYGRNSIDDHGLPLIGSVHFGVDYDNAYWDGTQMVFGDGDGTLFNRFTASVDIMGHELTHGVTASLANLAYEGQSGALNESVSDVFGSLVKQYAAKQTAEQADWLIGEGLLAAGVDGIALRSMKAPGTAYDDPRLGKDPQPATMKDYVKTTSDSGGVHTNSGIPNHAFYLAAIGFGGNAWEQAGKVWYATLSDPALSETATFAQFAAVTATHAESLFGATGRKTVVAAWDAVGVSASASK